MAQKGKNESLKDKVEKVQRKKHHKDRGPVEMDCGHSPDVLPYLLMTEKGPSAHREMDTSEKEELRRLYKRAFGYKPVGLSVAQMEAALRR